MRALRHAFLRSSYAQFTLLGLRGVLRERSVLFWSFLFPLLVTTIFLQAFSTDGRPEPLRLGVAGLPAEESWLVELGKERAVTLVRVDEELAKVPGYVEVLAKELKPGDLPAPLREVFFVRNVDGLVTGEGFFSIKASDAAARDSNRILAAKARARRETMALKPVRVEGVGYADWFAPGMIGLTLLTGGLFGTSFRLSSDREQGLFRRYMLTPFRRSDYVLGFVTARGVFVVLQAALLLVLFRVAFGFEVHGSLATFFLLIVAGALSANLLGAAIASRIRKSEVAGGVANVFFFPMMFLSGVYFRTESFPPWLKGITDYFALSALNSALRKVANQGLGLASTGFELAVLSGWIVACLVITVVLFDWGVEA